MFKFICLGSGSCGNCYYLNAEGYGIIIDMGLGLRSMKKHFRDYGLSLAQIGAILVTHDHTDHVKSVGALSNEFHLPVYSTQEVHDGMVRNNFMTKKVRQEEKHILQPHQAETVGPFRVTAFPVPHDSSGNNGYFIEYGNTAFCLITDAGHLTPEMLEYLGRAHYLVVEANYDTTMLETGPYPQYLKRRIMGPAGHLCNDETAQALAAHLSEHARHIWLCHLSEENNHPELARKTVESVLLSTGYVLGKRLRLEVLKRKVPSELYELE